MAQDNGAQDNDIQSGTLPSEKQVEDYLRAHPDFLYRHQELFQILTPPARELGDGVTDLQQAMISHLRQQIAKTEDLAQILIDNSRDNLTSQNQIHDCVLALLSANTFQELVEITTTDLAVVLGLDVIALCVETGDDLDIGIRGLQYISPGLIDEYVGGQKGILLRSQTSGDPEIYGGAAPLIMSDAMVRLDISPEIAPAMIAFGSRDANRFNENQATELLHFLSRAMAELIRIWLVLPQDSDED
ncbi:DUF484 family protein [Aestuariispira insulae]|uniref:DUF484 family protein n=1 Tax=Aestuariispira insulae TaxID=1461337 RepID=A0A3D9HI35_9PROT|nr:DUF484 family protein [Aestuariispira insulae]RED49104.1 hypothetical protein DFP90_10681 [Aestuariispira insulae]